MWHYVSIRQVDRTDFYSHIPCGMWPKSEPVISAGDYFYSHIPCGMWHILLLNVSICLSISTHTSRVGCDFDAFFYLCCVFLLTHPVWDVTTLHKTEYPLTIISTHTSRVGCDREIRARGLHSKNFYSHIPCGMWRSVPRVFPNITFLLTHPVWDVTPVIGQRVVRILYFYSHIPCGMWLL